MNNYQFTKIINFIVKRLFCISLFLACGSVVNAQSIPSIQKTGYFAPANTKIDGKATEWKNQFQAHNKSNQIYYTIANNLTNLYLIIQTSNKQTINKICSNGISLTIAPDKKQLNKAFTVTFPFYKKGEHHGYLLQQTSFDTKDTLERRLFTDSVMNQVNQKIETTFKFIRVTDTVLVPDSMLSVYNTDGIKAVARIDNKLVYTYEMTIPLKYLKDNMVANKFSYNIKLNGTDAQHNIDIIHASRGDVLTFKSNGTSYMLGYTSSPTVLFDAYSTDFWGEYTTVSK